MIEGQLWVWQGKEDGDLFEAKITVERSDVDEVQITASVDGQKSQTIYMTRFNAGRVAQALADAAAGEA